MQILKFRKVSTNKTSGEEKVYWEKCGVLFEGEKGIKIKIDAMPINWDGWLYAFSAEEKQTNTNDENIPF